MQKHQDPIYLCLTSPFIAKELDNDFIAGLIFYIVF